METTSTTSTLAPTSSTTTTTATATSTTARVKRKKQRPKVTIPNGSGSIYKDAPSSTNNNNNDNSRNTELGLMLSGIILILYIFGLFRTIASLPEPNPGMKRLWMSHGLEKIRNQFGGGGHVINLSRFGLVPDVRAMTKGLSSHVVNVVAAANVARPKRTDGDNNNKNNKNSNSGSNSIEMTTKGKIPSTHWPASIRNEDGNFEDVIHPGDGRTVMTVPKFWSEPIHDHKLMSRELAMKIGSCVEPDSKTGSYARGDKCPVHQRTIFVAIASYRDWQCRYTVESAILRAKYPERIRVAVVDQILDGEDVSCDTPIHSCTDHPDQALCKYKDQVDVFQVDAPLAVGPVFARHLGHRMYRGEYYATQSDAHVTFTQDWDADIIDQMESTKDEMAVLSTYLTDIVGSIDKRTGKSLRHTRPIMCNTEYEGGIQGQHLRHLSQPETEPDIYGVPQLQPYWAAGYSFSRGHFVVNVPYDFYQPMIFQGEEMSIGLRAFTIGYDFFAPERSVCFHSYADGPNKKAREKVKHFWENAGRYRGTGIKAMARLLGIVDMNPEVDRSTWDHTEESKYGIGGVRTTQKFYDTFGIDVVNKSTEKHLCQFVRNGRMHKKFMPNLRRDGMGINYDKIGYKWKDPYGRH